nr:RICIN domain-containing protein [Streptomyces spiramenti]
MSRLIAAPLALAAALLLPGAALAAPTAAAGPEAAAPTAAPAAPAVEAAVTAAAPTQPKYFLGAGYGPYNIAVEAAYGTAYAAAAGEGYPAANCRVSAGPAAHQINANYWQVLLELLCTPPPPAGSGQIVGVHSGRCIDVHRSGLSDGTPIQLFSCNNTDAQRWRLEADGTLRAFGRCMDVQFGRTDNGSHVGLNTCHGADNQRWEVLPGGLLRSVHSGKCLDALGWGTGDRTRLGIWDCTPHHTNQQWRGAPLGT